MVMAPLVCLWSLHNIGVNQAHTFLGDPASLGVPAVLLGKTDITYAIAAKSEVDYMKYEAPRWFNGAISHRADVPELWADFIVSTHDSELLFQRGKPLLFDSTWPLRSWRITR